ncbi:MAG: aspartate ammonia-lyase [Candidatus Omnitrophica bacterium]|nr:aspartate ammonia-lyase [Candidatus Omnitrophota bacterium]
MKNQKMRAEKDSLGEMLVPEDAYYGTETARAIQNYPISGLRFHPIFVWATAVIKKAAAEVNMNRGALNPKIAKAIIRASEEVMEGKFLDQFCVDVFQSGAGVSQHMNTNEVITNRALEILGYKKGDYSKVHSHDHVNMGQSTNDVVPAALRIAATKLLSDFYSAAEKLEKAFSGKAREFSKIVKAGRTHMQDAAPVTLGQEFSGYAASVRKGKERVEEVAKNLFELGIGGSAVGTGLNTTLEYRKNLVMNIAKITEFPFKSALNMFEVMQSTADFSGVSGALRTLALSLIQISNDLRLLSSGPKTGFAEITLPSRQPGSSIMPGKINPVMAEVTAITCFQVVGNDVAISLATQAGQLELNVMIPTVIHNLLQSIEILKNVMTLLAEFCVAGIQVDTGRCLQYAETSYGIAAALNPYIGYSKAAEIVKESVKTGKTLRELVLEKGLLSEEKLSQVLSPKELTEPKVK